MRRWVLRCLSSTPLWQIYAMMKHGPQLDPSTRQFTENDKGSVEKWMSSLRGGWIIEVRWRSGSFQVAASRVASWLAATKTGCGPRAARPSTWNSPCIIGRAAPPSCYHRLVTNIGRGLIPSDPINAS